jgi:RNA polymerase-binding transcription factor DksA
MNTEAYKERLTDEKTQLEGELASIGRRNPSNPADWEAVPDETGREPEEGDTADAIEGYAENVAVLNDLENRYNEVLAALARIEAGTYGTCTVGGETIEAARLEANPAAATCIAHTK